jgi:hypothetical protein
MRKQGCPDQLAFIENPEQLKEPYLQLLFDEQGLPVGGDHSVTAVKSLSVDYPKNPKWMHVEEPRVYIAEDTKENREMLRLLGEMDNIQGDKRKKYDFADRVSTLRSAYVQLCQTYGMTPGDMDKFLALSARKRKSYEEACRTMRAKYTSIWEVSSGGVGHIWQMVKKDGQTWGLIWAIISPTGIYACSDAPPVKGSRKGKTKKKKQTPPKSTSPFTALGGLDTANQRSLLKMVLNGAIQLKHLGKKCQSVKAELCVREMMLSACNVRTWAAAEQKYPTMTTKSKIHQHTTFFLQAADPKAKLAKQLQAEVNQIKKARLAAEKAKNRSDKEKANAQQVRNN